MTAKTNNTPTTRPSAAGIAPERPSEHDQSQLPLRQHRHPGRGGRGALLGRPQEPGPCAGRTGSTCASSSPRSEPAHAQPIHVSID